MTAYTFVEIGCDYPDCPESTAMETSTRSARIVAKSEGWRFTKDGRDLCPAHKSTDTSR